jgi:hypothetical protein
MRKDPMGNKVPPTLRFFLILLAIADLALLGMRLWPWQDVTTLPLNGATGIDPGVALVGYIAFFFWISGSRTPAIRGALFSAAWMGLLAGLILVAQVLFKAQPAAAEAPNAAYVRVGLLLVAALVWGIAGYRGSKMTSDATVGMLCGLWCAMTSSLMACGTLLAQMFLNAPVPNPNDPWKQYEGLAVGNAATQALVLGLNSATWFLLVCPLAGGALGLIFGLFGQGEKS